MLNETILGAIKILYAIEGEALTKEELLKSIPIDEKITHEIIEKLKSGLLLKISSSGHHSTAKPLKYISILEVISVIGEELHIPQKQDLLLFEKTSDAAIILSTINTFVCKQLARIKIDDFAIR